MKMNFSSEPQSLYYYHAYILCGAGERSQGYSLLLSMKAKTASAVQRYHFFLLAPHGGIRSCIISKFYVHIIYNRLHRCSEVEVSYIVSLQILCNILHDMSLTRLYPVSRVTVIWYAW